MEEFISVPFKKWIREQIKTNVVPILHKQGFKKGKATSYVRECNGIIQMVIFRFREDEVCLEAEIFPVYFPSEYGCLSVIVDEYFPVSRNAIMAQSIYTEDDFGQSSWFWGTRPRTAHEWKEVENVIKRTVLPRFDAVQSLDELMKSPMRIKCDEQPNDIWKGIFLYIDAIYDCLTGDFDTGMQELRAAQDCKQAYLGHLASLGKEYGKYKDDFYPIYTVIDDFCNTVKGENYNKETFLAVYERVCDEARKWFKV